MKCPKCGSENASVQLVSETKEVEKKKSFLYKITIGWIIFLVKWIFFTLPAIILKIFGIGGKKTKLVNETVSYGLCQDCGNKWKVN